MNTAVKGWLRSVEAELLMLHALGAHADDNFECEFSVPRLALMTGFSKRHTGRVLHQLRAMRMIAFDDHPGGRGKTTTYRLLVALGNPDIEVIKSEKKGSFNAGNGF